MEVMINVPKKANDAMHLSMMEGIDVNVAALGEVLLQVKEIILKLALFKVLIFERISVSKLVEVMT